MSAIKVGIAGLGTVAQGVVQTLQRNANLITGRAAGDIRVTAVASRSAKPDVDLHGARFSTDLMSLVGAPDVDVVVELLGGEQPALDLCRAALAAGQHVVTANKALIAHHGVELHELATKHNVSIAYEAAVAGAIPVLGAIGRGLAGNQIEWLAGIINGTSNFILSAMAGDTDANAKRKNSLSFAEALNQAQELGYAEADPTFDVEGIDAAHKLAILTSLAFGTSLNFPAVFTEGISEVTVEDIEYAAQLGYVIKHLGIARQTANGIEARVHPALVPAKNLLAQVDGVMNAVMVGADGAGPTMYYGAGAGMQPTASAVVADLVDIALQQVRQPVAAVPMAYLGIEDIVTSYYLRVPVHDRSGVFARLTTALSELGISIEAAVQREHTRSATKIPGGEAESVPIVLLTQDVTERTMQAALTQLQALSEVAGRIRCIRVEALEA